MASKIKITPLGGLGQIGSNMVLFQTEQTSFIIDAGILFPYENFFDINYLIPDFSQICKPENLIITHGHEDHIGAIVHLVEKFPDIPIYAPPFAAALIRKKFDYRGILKEINEYSEDYIFKFKDIKIHPIHVNHSIPQTFGLLLKKNEDALFYVSDFKIDYDSPYEKAFNFSKLKKLSENTNRRILLADSTNILSKNSKTPGEGSIISNIKEIFKRDYKRIFITTFSSNIHRLNTILQASLESDRNIVPVGRSINSYATIAEELGILNNWSSSISNYETIKNQNKKSCIIVSGCQGDFKSALRRIASGEDLNFRPSKGDLFIFSSKSIPGNEKRISLLINNLFQMGAHVITDQDEAVHVSGHPGKEDLLEVISNFNATDFVPIHGEVSFLYKHSEWIKSNYPKINNYILLNHETISLDKNIKIIKSNDQLDPILIHGKGIEIERKSISERRKMACNGTIFCSVIKKEICFTLYGLPKKFKDDELDKLINIAKREIGKNRPTTLKEELRISIRRFCHEKLGYKPIVMVHAL